MQTISRREFIKSAGAVLIWLVHQHSVAAQRASDAPPAPLGRIASWWRQAVYKEADRGSDVVAWKRRDEVIPLYAAVVGKAPWPSNPIWYQTDGGFIHSGYVQPVENAPSGEVIAEVTPPGFWAQVCVPFVSICWQPGTRCARTKLYYGTVYRVVGATTDPDGNWWYRLKEGITYSPGPYVPAWSVRRIPPEELAPISPGRSDKRIEIAIDAQVLTCFEGESAVFSTPVSTGVSKMATPRGEHRVLYKRHTQRMIGGSGDDIYDLPGVAFPVYFTRSAVAIHGTYWHNDFGRRHSHGCVNVTSQAAQWIFRWSEPVAPYTEHTVNADPKTATRVVVI